MIEQISKYHYNLSTTITITMLLLTYRILKNNTHLKKYENTISGYAANSAVW